MHFEFLVEELSAEVVLYNVVPKIIGNNITFCVHSHQGKADLLGKLPGRLRGYKAWLPDEWKIVVLVDVDSEDCLSLKARINNMALEAGLKTKSRVQNMGQIQFLSRLAIEELEAWFFGDVDAHIAAYPRISPHLGSKERFRNPDTIIGGTWESLERVLKRQRYHLEGLPKVQAARDISIHMDPERNRSQSFRVFRQGLLELAGLST